MNIKSKLLVTISLFIFVPSCSGNISPTKPNNNFSKADTNISESRFRFSTKELTQSYLKRKLLDFLNTPGKEADLVKEIAFEKSKNPTLFQAIMADDQVLLAAIDSVGQVTDRKALDPSFAKFINDCYIQLSAPSGMLLVHDTNGSLADYYIGIYETKQSDYVAAIGSNPSNHQGDNKPVESVTWFDAIKFCNAKSIRENIPVAYNTITGELLNASGIVTTDLTAVKGYRLPTTTEWLFAATGGNSTHGYVYSGSNNPDLVDWHSTFSTQDVGTLAPNELGLYDMSGNVWEWTNSGSSNRDRLGGSCFNGTSIHVTNIFSYNPNQTAFSFGFRIAKSAS
jgi:hypothetical protein